MYVRNIKPIKMIEILIFQSSNTFLESCYFGW